MNLSDVCDVLPSIDRVHRDPEVSGDLGDGVPMSPRRGRAV